MGRASSPVSMFLLIYHTYSTRYVAYGLEGQSVSTFMSFPSMYLLHYNRFPSMVDPSMIEAGRYCMDVIVKTV
jgi:hypothetical protein